MVGKRGRLDSKVHQISTNPAVYHQINLISKPDNVMNADILTTFEDFDAVEDLSKYPLLLDSGPLSTLYKSFGAASKLEVEGEPALGLHQQEALNDFMTRVSVCIEVATTLFNDTEVVGDEGLMLSLKIREDQSRSLKIRRVQFTKTSHRRANNLLEKVKFNLAVVPGRRKKGSSNRY